MASRRTVYLSQNPKRLRWLIFRNTSVVDTIVVLTFVFAGAIWWFMNLTLPVKIGLSLTVWLTGGVLNLNYYENKFYKQVWLWIVFLCGKKTHPTPQQWPLYDPRVYQHRNQFVVGWRVETLPPETLGEAETDRMTRNFARLLRAVGHNETVSFYKTTTTVDFTPQLENITKRLQQKLTTFMKEALTNEQTALQNLADKNKGHHHPVVYCFVAFTTQAQALRQTAFLTKVVNQTFKATPLSSTQTQQLVRSGLMGGHGLVEVKPTHISVNHQKRKLWSVYRYPTKTRQGWLRAWFSIPQTEALLNVASIPKEQALRFLNNALQKTTLHLEKGGQPARVLEAQAQREDVLNTIKTIQADHDTLKETNVLLLADTTSKHHEATVVNHLKNTRLNDGLRYTPLLTRQAAALQSFGIGHKDVLMPAFGTPFTSAEIATSYFFRNYGLYDPLGFLLGQGQINHEPVVFDPFVRTNARTNANTLVLGKIGSGKSYLMKKIIKQQVLNGTKVFVVDPDNEYEPLTRALGGQFVNFHATNQKLNPLQFGNVTDDEDTISAFETQLSFVKTFYQTAFPQIKELYLNILTDLTRTVYCKHKLHNPKTAAKLLPQKWPTFTDVATALPTYAKHHKLHQEHTLNLTAYLQQLTTGTFGTFFNHPTTVRFNHQVTTFGLQGVFAGGNRTTANLCLFVVLNHVEQAVSANKAYNTRTNANERVLVVVDEAHLLADAQNPVAVRFLYTQTKRIRKYRGGVVIGTQDLQDLIGSAESTKYTAGIVNNCQYHFYGHLDAGNLQDLNKLHQTTGGLNQAVLDGIHNAQQGDFYFRVTSNEAHLIHVTTTPEETLCFNTEAGKVG